MTVLVFDIETIPDIASGTTLYNLDGLNDSEKAQAMFALRREKTGNDFLPHYLQKVAAISLVFCNDKQLKVGSIADEHSEEKEIISKFFAMLDKHSPTLVSWNGTGFDLPVLHYRALYHSIAAPQYWETGEHQQAFKWNNYINRYHYRHLDLMDVLSSYQAKAYAPLDDIATMLGFPGKMGMSGAKVWDHYLEGDIKGIRDYCETDVLNTYGVYLRFELMRGTLTEGEYQEAILRLKDYLQEDKDKAHFQEFLQKMR